MELSAKMSSVHKDIEKLKRRVDEFNDFSELDMICLLYTSPSPRD